jgi:hypothetical protein
LTPGIDWLNEPLGIATDQNSFIYAANFGEKGSTRIRTISKLDADGNPVVDWFVEGGTFARDLAFHPAEAQVPLPSSILLLVGGLGALLSIMRVRRA